MSDYLSIHNLEEGKFRVEIDPEKFGIPQLSDEVRDKIIHHVYDCKEKTWLQEVIKFLLNENKELKIKLEKQ